jgi:hypothetical protein
MPKLDNPRRSLDKLDPEEQVREILIKELRKGNLHKILKLLEELPKMQDEDDPSAALHAARTRNMVRALMRRARLRDECLRSSDVQKHLGMGRERLRQLRNEGRLVAIPRGERRSTLYPYWQFEGQGTVKGLEEIIEASKELGIGSETLHFFMTAPNDRLGGGIPVDILQDDNGVEQVVGVLRSSGLGPF